ncbi:MAG: hypothetical protein SRB2_00981 [Desulfobacteraceae bacterium Eth-SRB2]|nr:MAG: hypothetical protein SRB2_00981 [Desulfobacteraceae bacterium Eth-SRB2]
MFGGAEGGRTPDLMTASHALSQLSYSPMQKNLTKGDKRVNKYFIAFYDWKMLTKLKTINIIGFLIFTTYCIYKIF